MYRGRHRGFSHGVLELIIIWSKTMQSFNIKISEDHDASHHIEYDFGTNLESAVELYGEAVVFSRYVSSGTIALQNVIRTAGRKSELPSDKGGTLTELSTEELQTIASAWTVTEVTDRKVDNMGKATKALSKLTPAQRVQALQDAMAELDEDQDEEQGADEDGTEGDDDEIETS